MRHSSRLALGASCAVLTLVASQARAQETNTNEPVGQEYTGLEIITVTAQRGQDNQQDVPISLEAFDGNDLAAIDAANFQQLSNYVPNLTVVGGTPFGSNTPLYSIRGISTANARISAEQGVALYIDGLYYARTGGSLLRLVDIESVEVLRGPQGTLFGRNATAGAISYNVKVPEDEFSAYADVAYGTSDRVDLVGMVNVPVGDWAAFRLNAGYWRQDGYIDVIDKDGNFLQDTGNVDDLALRGALRLTPTDRLTIDLTASYARGKGESPAAIITDFSIQDHGLDITTPGTPFPTAGTPAFNQLSPQLRGYIAALARNPEYGGQLVAQDPRIISPDGKTRNFFCLLDQVTPISGDYIEADDLCRFEDRATTEVYSLKAEYEFTDAFSVRYTGGIINGDVFSSSGLFGNLYNRYLVTDIESTSHEVILNYDNGPINAILGGYYFNETPTEHTGEREHIFFTAPPLRGDVEALESFNAIDVETKAVFANLTYEVSDQFTLSGGLRYSHDRKESVLGYYDVSNGGLNEAAIVDEGLDPTYDYDGDGVLDSYRNGISFDSVDWRVAAQYFAGDNQMLYATVSTGFKAGGFSGGLITHVPTPDCTPAAAGNCVPYDNPVRPYGQEDVVNYELGIKADWLDRRLRTNLTLFAMDFSDMIVEFATFNKPQAGGPSFPIINAGDVLVSGFEGDVQAAVTDDLTLKGSFGYTDYDWKRLDPLSELYFLNADGTCGPENIPFDQVNVDNCPIRDLKAAPTWSFSLGVDYQLSLGVPDLKASFNYGWKSSFETANGANSIRQPAYGVASLYVEYDSNTFWSLALNGTNIFDQDFILAGLNLNGQSPTYTSSYVPGRGSEWFLTLSFRY